MTKYLFDELAQNPHILAFAGQSTPWVQALKEAQKDEDLSAQLRDYNNSAKNLLNNIYAQLLANAGKDINVFDALESTNDRT